MTLLHRWFFLAVVYVRPHYASPRLPKLADNRSVRIASREELLLASRTPLYELEPTSIEAAIARGNLCIAAFENEKIIAYLWRAFSATPHVDGLWVDFGAKYRYGYKAFTHPKYRQQKLQHLVSLLTDPLMIERGYTHGISFIETHNFASRISDARRGSICVGYAGYFKLFGKVLPFRSPGAKTHDFRFFIPDKRFIEDRTKRVLVRH